MLLCFVCPPVPQAVPPELARHEAARQDPKAGGGKKKDDVLYLKGM